MVWWLAPALMKGATGGAMAGMAKGTLGKMAMAGMAGGGGGPGGGGGGGGQGGAVNYAAPENAPSVPPGVMPTGGGAGGLLQQMGQTMTPEAGARMGMTPQPGPAQRFMGPSPISAGPMPGVGAGPQQPPGAAPPPELSEIERRTQELISQARAAREGGPREIGGGWRLFAGLAGGNPLAGIRAREAYNMRKAGQGRWQQFMEPYVAERLATEESLEQPNQYEIERLRGLMTTEQPGLGRNIERERMIPTAGNLWQMQGRGPGRDWEQIGVPIERPGYRPPQLTPGQQQQNVEDRRNTLSAHKWRLGLSDALIAKIESGRTRAVAPDQLRRYYAAGMAIPGESQADYEARQAEWDRRRSRARMSGGPGYGPTAESLAE
jgi:hypothetical protein